MKRPLAILACAAFSTLALRADGQLTATQIETLENHGWITLALNNAAQAWIAAKQAAAQEKSDSARYSAELPDLQKQVADEDAKVAQLKEEAARYVHPDETDFAALQAAMRDSNARPEGQAARAQAYVWTYPDSPHEAEAAKYLQQVQKEIADRQQAAENAAAAAAAAQAKLLQRVKARDLSLGEWSAFLEDKSQTEVTEYLGLPGSREGEDHWLYPGAWTVDPETRLKAGLLLTFNGGRVQHVAPAPLSTPTGTQ